LRALFGCTQGLILTYEAGQDEYLFDSIGAEKIIESKILVTLPPYLANIFAKNLTG
tara:strand:+ start:188 stop:355 length:168 start_codon:yes stop_codon:yes gene_type:complete